MDWWCIWSFNFQDVEMCFTAATFSHELLAPTTFSLLLFFFPFPPLFSVLPHLPPSSPFLLFLPHPPLLSSSSSISRLLSPLRGLGGNPSQFSSLRAPIKKGLACVICQTIVPSPSFFAPAPLFLLFLPAPLSPSLLSISVQPDLSYSPTSPPLESFYRNKLS